MTTTHDYFILL